MHHPPLFTSVCLTIDIVLCSTRLICVRYSHGRAQSRIYALDSAEPLINIVQSASHRLIHTTCTTNIRERCGLRVFHLPSYASPTPHIPNPPCRYISTIACVRRVKLLEQPQAESHPSRNHLNPAEGTALHGNFFSRERYTVQGHRGEKLDGFLLSSHRSLSQRPATLRC